MATEKNSAGQVGSGNSVADRTKKATATRAITQTKLGKLSPQGRYAHGKIMAARRALEDLADHVIDGGSVSGELLSAVAEVEGQIGQCMFATR
jgi:hypothetical protein